jgi:TolA-binding protein
MKIKALIFFIFLALTSCSGRYSLKNEIKRLEAALTSNKMPSDSLLKPLLLSYSNYVQKYPKDRQTPIYLFKIGNLYLSMQNWKEASKHFEFIIDAHQKSAVYQESILLAAYSYEAQRGNKEERAAILYKLYLDKFPDGKGIEQAKFFFQPDDVKMRSRIAEYQNQLYKDNAQINPQTANLLIKQYMSFVRKYRQHDFSPNYCFEAGKLASSIGETKDAVEFWLIILEDYPDFRFYPETMLLLAVEYETKMPLLNELELTSDLKSNKRNYKIDRFDLNKTNWNKEAERLYKRFLEKYPKHELAEQAKASLQQLGKSANEVVMGFQNKLENVN